MADKPEILVHVGAPSAASDDARYRALVASSLAFEPVSRYSVLRIHDNYNGTGLEVSVDDTCSLSLISSASQVLPRREETTSFHSGDELCSLAPPNEVEKSKVLARASPQPRDAATVQQFKNKNISFHPDSTEEDSELSFQPLIPLTHQSRIQSQPGSPHKPASAHETTAGMTGIVDESKNSPIIDNDVQQSSTWETPLDAIPDSQEDQTNLNHSVQVDRSFVPDSILQPRCFGGKEKWTEESRLSDITRIPSSIPSPSPERTSDRQVDLNQSHKRPPEHTKSDQITQSNAFTSVLGKRKESENNNHTRSSGISTTKTAESSLSSSSRPTKRQTLPQATETISLENLPIEIRAPDPPVSYGKFRTHITPTLRSLAERMKQSSSSSSSRFKPVRQTRVLQPLERGYWFIPSITIVPGTSTSTSTSTTISTSTSATASQTWTQTLFSQFWCFLRDFLTEGRAGWGIWCLLESCDSTTTTANNNTNHAEAQTVNLKLYTWGEVAPHIYLLLFLATERRIRKMPNVEWRDARDEGVIIMT